LAGTKTGCKVCDDKVARVAVDETLAKGLSAEGTARLMTLRGYGVTGPTILKHKAHALVPVVPPNMTKRDLTALVVEKTIDAIENGDIAITDEKLWKNVGPGLKAQGEINKMKLHGDDRQTALVLAALLAGKATGYLAPIERRILLDDPGIIEGEATEVD
jgi:hypothetical protein